MPYYKRKSTRLKNFDYATENYYFVTICTHNKTCIFGKTKDLNEYGSIASDAFSEIEKHYSNVRVDQYIVMPNHVHAIICICNDSSENTVSLNTVVGLYKSGVTRRIRQMNPDMQVWQRSFHDRVIRNQKEYEHIWNYVRHNDQKWIEDCFYVSQDE